MKQNKKKAKNQIFMSFVHDNGCWLHKRPHKGHKGSVLYMVMAVGGLLRPSGRIPLGPLSGLPRGPLEALLVVPCTLLAAHPRALQATAWAARGAPGGKKGKTQTFFFNFYGP